MNNSITPDEMINKVCPFCGDKGHDIIGGSIIWTPGSDIIKYHNDEMKCDKCGKKWEMYYKYKETRTVKRTESSLYSKCGYCECKWAGTPVDETYGDATFISDIRYEGFSKIHTKECDFCGSEYDEEYVYDHEETMKHLGE